MSSQGSAIVEQGCKYSNISQNTRITIGLDNLTNTFASADETTGDALTARTGLALCSRCHRAWASEGTLGPSKDTHGTPVPLQRDAVGGPRHAPRDHHDDKNQGYRDTLWLPTKTLLKLDISTNSCALLLMTSFHKRARRLAFLIFCEFGFNQFYLSQIGVKHNWQSKQK